MKIYRLGWAILYMVTAATLCDPAGSRPRTPENRPQLARVVSNASAELIIDSHMTDAEAFSGLDPACPQSVRKRQRLVTVRYVSFDGRLHQGQIVVDSALVEDVKVVFASALKAQFPIQSVIPMSAGRFRTKKGGRWDDDLSVAANNTSGFNYRRIKGTRRLSNHAKGKAIDINPMQNPSFRSARSPHSKYVRSVRGTLLSDSVVTRGLLQRGWIWGGTWRKTKDYQHFEKVN